MKHIFMLTALCAAALAEEPAKKEEPKPKPAIVANAKQGEQPKQPTPIAVDQLLALRFVNLQLQAELLTTQIFEKAGVKRGDYEFNPNQGLLIPIAKPVSAAANQAVKETEKTK